MTSPSLAATALELGGNASRAPERPPPLETGTRFPQNGRMQDQVAMYFRAIGSSVDRVVATLGGLDASECAWRPDAGGANSLGAIVTHVLANVEENVLGTLCGQVVERDREAEFEPPTATVAAQTARWPLLREQMYAALDRLDAEALAPAVDHPRRGRLSGWEVLLVAARHAAEHAGEAELTRNLLRAAPPPTRR